MADCSKPSLFELALYKKTFFKLTSSGVIRESEVSNSASPSSSSSFSPSSSKTSRTTFTPPGSDGALGLTIATAMCAEPSSGPIVSDAARRSELKAMAHGLAAASFDPQRCVLTMNAIMKELSEDYTIVIRHLDKKTTMVSVYYTGEDSRTIWEEVVLCREPVVPIELEMPPPPPPPPFRMAEFLRKCLLCSKGLDGKDAYIYKGEKAFCSDECRYQHILDERKLAMSKSAGTPETEKPAFPCSSPVVFEIGTSTP